MYKLEKLKHLLIFFLLSFFAVSNSWAEDKDEAEMFATFIYGVTTSIQSGNPGEICVFGYDEIAAAISVKSKNNINLDRNPEKYTSCHAVYVAKDKSKVLRNYVEKFNHKKIITVGVLENFNENGGMIFIQIGRRNFEITVNAKQIKEAGIKLPPTVLEFVIN